jgi:hypothetical protein
MRGNVDVWAEKQADKPGRSEAMRRLIDLGLAAAPAKPRGKPKSR